MKKFAQNNKLLQPFSMEERLDFLRRFDSDKLMRELFNREQRITVSSEIFENKWKEATVTVKKLNGNRFFIA